MTLNYEYLVGLAFLFGWQLILLSIGRGFEEILLLQKKTKKRPQKKSEV
jgi:hypothetical protein